ncbi:hypothetical protein QTP88_013807 [Uroleucon formosanum]
MIMNNTDFITRNCIEEVIVKNKIISEPKKKSVCRSLFEDIGNDEERVVNHQSEEIEETSEGFISVWNDSAIKHLIELRRDKDKYFALLQMMIDLKENDI